MEGKISKRDIRCNAVGEWLMEISALMLIFLIIEPYIKNNEGFHVPPVVLWLTTVASFVVGLLLRRQ